MGSARAIRRRPAPSAASGHCQSCRALRPAALTVREGRPSRPQLRRAARRALADGTRRARPRHPARALRRRLPRVVGHVRVRGAAGAGGQPGCGRARRSGVNGPHAPGRCPPICPPGAAKSASEQGCSSPGGPIRTLGAMRVWLNHAVRSLRYVTKSQSRADPGPDPGIGRPRARRATLRGVAADLEQRDDEAIDRRGRGAELLGAGRAQEQLSGRGDREGRAPSRGRRGRPSKPPS